MSAPKIQIAKIAVAVAFSPRLKAVLSEARRFAERFGAQLTILHAGKRAADLQRDLHAAMEAAGLPIDVRVEWLDGEPTEAILAWLKDARTDLLIAGALERERTGRHFLGTVARELLRRAQCSLLLFSQPRVEPHFFRKIIAVTDLTEAAQTAFRVALSFAEKERAESLQVVAVFSPLKAARAELNDAADSAKYQPEKRQAQLDEFASAAAAGSPVLVETRMIETTTGVSVCDFARSIEAELLVLPARVHQEGLSLLPSYMDWVFQVIPCNLWVVRTDV